MMNNSTALDKERYETFSYGLDLVLKILRKHGVTYKAIGMRKQDYYHIVGDIAGILMMAYVPKLRIYSESEKSVNMSLSPKKAIDEIYSRTS